jgi:hypothetical protein
MEEPWNAEKNYGEWPMSAAGLLQYSMMAAGTSSGIPSPHRQAEGVDEPRARVRRFFPREYYCYFGCTN